jgi:hypothetical protein
MIDGFVSVNNFNHNPACSRKREQAGFFCQIGIVSAFALTFNGRFIKRTEQA